MRTLIIFLTLSCSAFFVAGYDAAGGVPKEDGTIYPVVVAENVVYGEAYGYWTSYPDTGEDYKTICLNKKDELVRGRKMCRLTMDIYEPKGDTSPSRPLMVFIHGGAFFNGDKVTGPIVRWCRHFASLGYVVASINYRLGFIPTPSAITEAGFSAYLDADAAVRYLLYYKNKYRIDPDNIFVAGSSAGAITALNVAFMKEWDQPRKISDQDMINPWMDEPYTVRAVANLWGAVLDLGVLSNANTAIISFHGREDPVVPFDYDYPFQDLSLLKGVFFDKMYGSRSIQEEAENLGRKAELYVYNVEKHDLFYDDGRQVSSRLDEMMDRTASFFAATME